MPRTPGDIVQVPVPVEHLGAVFELLGRLERGTADDVGEEVVGDGPPTYTQIFESEVNPGVAIEVSYPIGEEARSVFVSKAMGRWSEVEVAQLAVATEGMPAAEVIDQIALHAPVRVPFPQLVEETGLGEGALKAQLATITKVGTEIAGRKSRPYSAIQTKAGHSVYRMPAEAAAWWKWCRSVLVAGAKDP